MKQPEQDISYAGNGTAGRENMTAPTGFFFQIPKPEQRAYEEIGAEMRNEEEALILQGLVKEFFEKYLNRVEESDSGKEFSPVTLNCCRVMMLEPLNDLLTKMAKLSGAKAKVTYEL